MYPAFEAEAQTAETSLSKNVWRTQNCNLMDSLFVSC